MDAARDVTDLADSPLGQPVGPGLDSAGHPQPQQGSPGDGREEPQAQGAPSALHTQLSQWGLSRFWPASRRQGQQEPEAERHTSRTVKAGVGLVLALLAALVIGYMHASSKSAQREMGGLQAQIASMQSQLSSLKDLLQKSEMKLAERDVQLQAVQSSQSTLDAAHKSSTESTGRLQLQLTSQQRALQLLQQHINNLANSVNASMAAATAASQLSAASNTTEAEPSPSSDVASQRISIEWITRRLLLVQDPTAMLSVLSGPLISADVTAHSRPPASISVFIYQILHRVFRSKSAPVVLPGARSLTHPSSLHAVSLTSLPHTSHPSHPCPVILELVKQGDSNPQASVQIKLNVTVANVKAVTLVASAGTLHNEGGEVNFSPEIFSLGIALPVSQHPVNLIPDAPHQHASTDMATSSEAALTAQPDIQLPASSYDAAVDEAAKQQEEEHNWVLEWMAAKGLTATTYKVL